MSESEALRRVREATQRWLETADKWSPMYMGYMATKRRRQAWEARHGR